MVSVRKRKTKHGSRWFVDYTEPISGRRRRKIIASTKSVAKTVAADIKSRVDRQGWGLPVGPDRKVSEFIEEYLTRARAEKSHKTSGWYRGKLHRFDRFIGKKSLRRVTREDIENFKLERLKEVTPATVAGDLRTLSTFFNSAIDLNYIQRNPVRGVKKPRMIAQNPPVFLSKTEARKLFEAAKDSRIFPMICTGLYSGLRFGEMLRLDWRDIDLERGVINVKSKPEGHTKSHKARTIPIAPALMTVLKSGRKSSGYCFWQPSIGYPYDAYRRELKRVCKEAGIKKIGWHTLRHTFASHLVMSRVDITTVSRLLGHSSTLVTEQYAHLAPDHLAGAVDKLDFGL